MQPASLAELATAEAAELATVHACLEQLRTLELVSSDTLAPR